LNIVLSNIPILLILMFCFCSGYCRQLDSLSFLCSNLVFTINQ